MHKIYVAKVVAKCIFYMHVAYGLNGCNIQPGNTPSSGVTTPSISSITNLKPLDIAGGSTVGNFRQGLRELLAALKNLEVSAAVDTRATITQMRNEVEELIKDVDERYKNNFNTAVNALDNGARKFFEGVNTIIINVNDSIEKGIDKGSSAATKALNDANIASHDVLYGLPCRNKIPRIVYSEPTSIDPVISTPVVKLRGNFLNIGNNQKVQINGKDAELIAVNANEAAVKIPDSFIASLTKPETISISLITNKITASKLACNQKTSLNENALSVAILVSPPISYKITGSIDGTWQEIIPEKKDSVQQAFSQEPFFERPDNCNHNESYAKEYSIPADWVVKDVNKHVETAGGDSDIERIVQDRNKVTVFYRIRGKGYKSYLGVKDCIGRGWLGFRLTIIGEKVTTTPSRTEVRLVPKDIVNIDGKPGQVTFSKRHTQASGFSSKPGVQWTYEVTINSSRGSKELPPEQLSSANKNSQKTSTKTNIVNGELTVETK
jgi:hypothetical protein